MTAEQHFAAGNLAAAVQAALDDVKKKPTELGPRWRLAEFLCLAGDLERADKQLETVLVQFPQQGPGISQFRNLLRGEQARREIAESGRVPEFLTEPTDSIKASLAALVALRAGDTAEAAKQTAAAEAARPPISGTADGQPFDDLRDLDDVLGGTLEAITGTGECAWIPLAHVASISFAKPGRSRDLLWREAAVTLHDGQRVNCFVPMIYSGTHKATTDALKLGRATEWSEPTEGLVRGTGQRMWLVGEDVKPVLEISEITIGSA